MKRLIVCAALLAGALVSFAQNKNITVSGSVIESDTKEAAVQATIQLLSLPDSTYVTGAATLAGGKFTLPKVAAGKYVLKISYIGFLTKNIPLQLSANKTMNDLGAIALESDAVLLQEAVVTAEAPPVTVKEDTVVYTASAYRTPEGAMLEELVKKLPGAEVSEDGKITINGKEIKKIMVDGKEFFSDDPQVSMKNLPVNMVENVKAYDRKSDMARITGIDDGDEEAVLDLTVKKGMKQGWFGNVIAGYGNKDRHEASAIVNRFRDNENLTVLASANNTNGKGFSEFGDAGQGMSSGRMGRGITTSRSLGVNYAKDTEKLQVGGNIQYGYSDNDSREKSSSERFLGEESSYTNSTDNFARKRHDVRLDFRLEWRPDTMTTIIFRPNASYSHTKTIGDTWSETLNNSREQINEKTSNSFSKSNNFSFNGRLQLFRRLNNSGRNISLGANFGYSDSESNSTAESYTEFFEQDSIAEWIRYTDRNSDSRNWSVSASYTEPAFKNHFLQLRYEFSHRKQLSQSLVSDPDSIMINDYVESLSSRVENFYDSHTIDASIRGMYPKLMYSAGVSFIPQSSRSETTIGPNANNELPTQNVLNFSPQIMLRYRFNRQHQLMFNYRGRSSQPNIEYLQEVIDQTDPLNIQYGNPNLKPSFNHSFRMFYNKYVPETMRSYNLNLFFNATQNSVAQKTTFDLSTGGRVSRRVNVNGNWDTRGSFSFSTPFKNRKYTLQSNTSSTFRNTVGYITVKGEEEAALNTTHNFNIGENLRGNYRTDDFDVSLTGSIRYNQVKNNKQSNSNRETFDYTFGGDTRIYLPWQLELSTDMNYRIKRGYGGDFNNNEAIWNAQLSKSFLKGNAATIRIKIYDILQQQTNLSRSISESMMTDSETNMLGSYFMVHFVYKFNTLGGKAPGQQRRGFGPGGDGPGGRGPGGGGHPGGGRPF